MATFKELNKKRKKIEYQDISHDLNNVQKSKCASCPFRDYGEGIGSEIYSEQEYYRR